MTPQSNIADRRAKRLRTFVIALGMICAASALAQAPQTPAVDIKVSEVPHAGKMINVPVNKGVLVDFSVPVREVQMANPDIADVRVTGPKQVLVSGKAFGTTQLVVWAEGDEQTIFDVAVDIDLERLQASITLDGARARR